MKPYSVIVIDDSAAICQLLSDILNQDPALHVIATAHDAYQAREKIKQFNPDVITLDVEMPGMDGLTFLKNLMRLRPMPVVMVSSLTQHRAKITLDAMEYGAVDYVAKPKANQLVKLQDYADELCGKVKTAAAVPTASLTPPLMSTFTALSNAINRKTRVANSVMSSQLIAIGASTGGTEAIKHILSHLPRGLPGIVIAQHIPKEFSRSFAERVNTVSEINVKQAEHDDLIQAGCAYIAPGDQHLRVEKRGMHYYCVLDDGPLVSRHRPSVNVLFQSIAEHVGNNALGIMLTGMGSDGADGMLEMKKAGALNLAQDSATSVVWGMPGSAVKCGAVDRQVSLLKCVEEIIQFSLG